jgi:V/A-type H+/Na+-transporting ATPase subunit I
MIAPMRKYAFVLHHDDYRDFLKALQELGVAHIARQHQGWAPAAEELIARWQRYRGYYQLLERRNISALPAEACPLASDLIRELESRLEMQYALDQALQQVRSQVTGHAEWADIPLLRFRALEQQGLFAHFFRCPPRQYQAAWAEEYLLETFREGSDDRFFVILSPHRNPPDLDAELLLPPDAILSELKARLSEIEAQILDNERGLDALAARRPALQKAMDALADTVNWQQALYQTGKDPSGQLLYLQAWVPADQSESLEALLHQSEATWLKLDVSPGEDIPVLLRNNRFVRLFQPIGQLFALPNAAELDLTAFFAPFFALFFGLCLGDLGYGAILFIAGTAFKFHPAGQAHRDALTLLQWLSFATMVVGVITGSFFSIPMANMAWFAPWKDLFLVPDQLFQLALWIGLFQIAAGMLLRVFNRSRQFGFLYGIASLGWLIGLIGAVMLWNDWMAPYHTWITLFGVALILFFSEPKGHIFKRFGLGLWELYGASGLVGDMLSYIRLFALGLSSSILGLVINDIALDVRGDGTFLSWIFFLLILAVGHGMNFFLATLSAFVHPMRLTFVEFYKNAGFSGGGKPYQPFSKSLKPEL